MIEEGQQEPIGVAWRETLLQRLLLAVTPLAAAALLMAIAGTDGRNRVVMSLLLPLVLLQLVAVFAKHWSFKLRASILIAPLFFAVYLAYGLGGFKMNGSVVAAAAIVLSGLLFGRRSMLITLGLLLLAPVAAGAGMLTGLRSIEEGADMSLGQFRPWLRTTFISVAIWTVLGLTVTFVVQRIELALANASEALVRLRAEEARRQQAEEERREAETAALQAQKLELVGRLAAGVAHDFNNLLGVVTAWSALALDEQSTANDRAQARQALAGVVQQGGALTRQLFALARQDARVVTRVCLEGSTQMVVLALQRILPANVKLSFRELSPAHVAADETEIQQVMFNLVLNARDAMPEGGAIEVTTGLETVVEPREVVGGTLAAGDWAILRVKDSGSGIEPAIRERIFELFYTTKPVGLGTGLGLATVLRIAQLSGGAVALDSAPGQGSTFTLYLPASR